MELDTVICGDALEVMSGMPDNGIDTVITDPPYGLSGEPDMAEVLTHWLAGDDYEHRGGGFMGKSWDSFVPGPSVWREVYRVMKPGGTLLAFGGTRTNDLLSIAIRLAGFQKFDEIDYYYGGLPPQCSWIYAQGFPKSLALDKAVDKHLGRNSERVVVGYHPIGRNGGHQQFSGENIRPWQERNRRAGHGGEITAPATEAAALWSGYGTGLKPAHEVILCFYKPREGSYANNALVWSVAGLWIDGGRVGNVTNTIRSKGNNPNSSSAFPHSDDDWTPHVTHAGHIGKRWPANLLLSHAPGCRRRGTRRVRGSLPASGPTLTGESISNSRGRFNGVEATACHADPDGFETVDDWACVESCPCRILGKQSGETGNGYRLNPSTQSGSGFHNNSGAGERGHNDTGTAARFFYQAKASRRERNMGCEDVYWRKDKSASIGFVRIGKDEWEALPERERARGNIHPTVKPLGIVEYLCTLTKTPTGGVVFDPFLGTGTTALGAIRTGRRWLGCDNEPDYVYLANLRIAAARAEFAQMELTWT